MRVHRPRGGFTLVELLVAIGLILILTALATAVAYSGILESHQLTAGTDRINSWLLQARGKATRDQAPRGVRFIRNPANPNLITEAQFIEVPDPYNPNPNGRADGYRLMFLYRQPASGPLVKEIRVVTGNGTAFPLSTIVSDVSVGDVLSLPEFGTLHRVLSVTPVPSTDTTNALVQLQNPAMPYDAISNRYVEIDSVLITVVGIAANTTDPTNLPDLGGLFHSVPSTPPQASRVANFSTTKFGFLRQPRPTLGEPTLQLSSGTVLDISPNAAVPTTLHDAAYAAGNPDLDVLFAPNGEVLNASQGKIILWVRNPEFPHPRTSGDARTNYEEAGEMSLIVVYTKTGTVSTQPVNIPVGAGPASPHAYANDGINNGL